MSLILATLTGPAFYPLPGIGRCWTPNREEDEREEAEKQAVQVRTVRQFAAAKHAEAQANRAKALQLLQQRDYTLEELAKVIGVSYSCAKDHAADLRQMGLISKKRTGNVITFGPKEES